MRRDSAVGTVVAAVAEYHRNAGESGAAPHATSDVTMVRVARPELRNIARTVGQPGFVDAYE